VHAQANAVPAETPDGRFHVHVATIAAAKGETHLATLILESCRNKRYDVQDALPFLCGSQSADAAADDSVIGQLMNLFVGATRPARLLAFAMHTERADAACVEKLIGEGWNVLDWTAAV
jgi:hypothetical protein